MAYTHSIYIPMAHTNTHTKLICMEYKHTYKSLYTAYKHTYKAYIHSIHTHTKLIIHTAYKHTYTPTYIYTHICINTYNLYCTCAYTHSHLLTLPLASTMAHRDTCLFVY